MSASGAPGTAAAVCSYLWRQGGLVPVPAARSDIFLSRELAAAEKRLLMRFLTNCMEAEQGLGRLKVQLMKPESSQKLCALWAK